ILVTLALITILGLIFLKGFKEAIGIAVVLVAVYLVLNVVVLGKSLLEVLQHPELLENWRTALFATKFSLGSFNIAGLAAIVLLSIMSFPRLALGLSGFETGVAVMPLVKRPNRVGNTRKLLRTAALIMSFALIASSFVTSVLIDRREFCPSIDCANGTAGHVPQDFCACTSDQIAAGTVTEA